MNVGVITTTPERVDDFLEYSMNVLDEYAFVPKEYSEEQAKEEVLSKEGTLVVQVEDEIYKSAPETVEPLRKGIEFTKGIFNLPQQLEQEEGNLKVRVFSDQGLTARTTEAVDKLSERLKGFTGEAHFYVKTSRALERMNEVESIVRTAERETRNALGVLTSPEETEEFMKKVSDIFEGGQE